MGNVTYPFYVIYVYLPSFHRRLTTHHRPATAVAWQTTADCGRVSPPDVALRRNHPDTAVSVVCHATAVAGFEFTILTCSPLS